MKYSTTIEWIEWKEDWFGEWDLIDLIIAGFMLIVWTLVVTWAFNN